MIYNYDTTSEELKPCPFCGGTPVWHIRGSVSEWKRTLIVKCQECGTEQRTGAISLSNAWLIQKAKDKWNSRTTKEQMNNLFTSLERIEVEDEEKQKHHCRTCKHRKRFELNDHSLKVVQCCDLQPSNRSNSGYKTIKVTDIACGFYEPKVKGDKGNEQP